MNSYPAVRRVESGLGGSRVEPELDRNWSDIEKLRWHAAVTTLDTGLRVLVHEMAYDLYGVQVENTGTTGKPYRDAWLYISGVHLGGQKSKELEGAIWYLAQQLDHELPHATSESMKALIDVARLNYAYGLDIKEKYEKSSGS